MRLIAVLLGGEGETHPQGRRLLAEDGAALLDYGFDNWVRLRPAGIDYGEVKVWKGEENSVRLESSFPVAVTVEKRWAEQLEVTFRRPEFLIAPIGKGTPAGTLLIFCGGTEVGRFGLQTTAAVGRAGFLKRALHSFILLVQGTD
jgi:D-alanyl-D-alanine carboxypeptidase